jgi:hypothetical protein
LSIDRGTRRALFVSLAVLLCLLPAVARASIPQMGTWDITLQGDVNGIGFTRPGLLVLGPTVTRVTTNGVNPVDVCIKSGSPFIAPETGAIWFYTNGICLNPNGALQDMAFVSADAQASTVVVRPDPAISATGINGFNQNNGLLANVYQIFDGSETIRFQGDGAAVQGSLNLLGTGSIYHSEQRYTATFSGGAQSFTPSQQQSPAPSPTAFAGCIVPKVKNNRVSRAKRKLRAAGCKYRVRGRGRKVRSTVPRAGVPTTRTVVVKTTRRRRN